MDYGALYAGRHALLRAAARRLDAADPGFAAFCAANAAWLEDYALFMALKEENRQTAWFDWPDPVRLRQPMALELAANRLAGRVHYWKAVQYLFCRQWADLKAYANGRGVRIIGDIPIYVSPDSSDLWASPELFQADKNGRLTQVAGCPPDAFAENGQLWGNPLYDWAYHKKTGYACLLYTSAAAPTPTPPVRWGRSRSLPARTTRAVCG